MEGFVNKVQAHGNSSDMRQDVRSATRKVKKYNGVQGKVSAHLVGGNPESFVEKHVVGWVGFQHGKKMCGVSVVGEFKQGDFKIYKLRKRMGGSLYFIPIS